MSLKRTYEQDLKAKILDALSYIPNVTVESTVTLDKEKYSRTREMKTRSQNGSRARNEPEHLANAG